VIRGSNGSSSVSFSSALKLCSLFAAMVFLGVGVAAAGQAGGAASWKAPAAAEKVKNPVPVTKAGLAAAKQLFEANCAMCHGNNGKGDGPVAAGLSPKPADFADAKLMSMDTDGGLFWKMTQGNSPMPAWDALPEKQRWELVNYIRTFAKKDKK